MKCSYILIAISLSLPALSEVPPEIYCDEAFSDWEFWIFWSDNDPKLMNARDRHKSVCQDVRFGRMTPKSATNQLRTDIGILGVVMDDMENASWQTKIRRFTIFTTSKVVGPESAPYWIIWFLSTVLLGLILLGSLLWESLEVPLLVLTAVDFVALLMLLAGGFVPFLEIVGMILGIITALIAIVIGMRSIRASNK